MPATSGRFRSRGNPTGGTFTLTFGGQTTAAIPFNATAAQVQTALQALATIGAGQCCLRGRAAAGDERDHHLRGYARLSAPSRDHGRQQQSDRRHRPAPTLAHTVTGSARVNDVQTLSLSGNPTGGTFTLSFGGQTTAAIPFNATAAQVQAALQALSSIGAGNVACAGGPLPGTA